MRRRVIVVGAGPAGLAIAIALRQRGVDARVLERLPRDRVVADAGGAYELTAATLRHLAAFGVADDVRRRGNTLTGFALRSQHDRLLQELDFARAGFEILSITRAELQRALWARLEALSGIVEGDARIASIVESDASVRVTLASGEVVEADVLVGADGMHSVVRRMVFGGAPAIDVGIAAHWGRTPRDVALELPSGRSLGFVGVGCSLVVTASEAEDAWLFTLCVADEAGAIAPTQAARALPSRARALIEGATRMSETRLVEQAPLPEWTSLRVLLIGDAAHGMTPFLGLGANSAIEDACLFGELLATSEGPDAWRALARVRRDLLVPRIVEARRLGAMMCSTSPVLLALFRAVTFCVPSRFVLGQLRRTHLDAEAQGARV